VGFAEVTISPPDPVGHPLAGYIARRGASKGLHDDIYLRVLFMEADGAVAIVSLDLLAVDEKMRDDLRGIASRTLGSVYTLVTATHTHSAPATLFSNTLLTYGLRDFREDYYRFFLERAAVAFEEASSTEPATLTFHETPVTGVATDRNDPRKPIDSTARALKFETPSGALLLLNYAVHPTVLGPKNLLISADIAGYAVRYLVNRGGLRGAVFVNSDSANVSTRFTRRNQSFEEAERLGKLLAEQVLSAIKSGGESIDATAVSIAVRNVDIEYKSPKEKASELEKNLVRLVFSSKGRRARTFVESVEAILALRKLSKLATLPRNATAEISWIRMNRSLGMLALPFEVHSEIGRQLRELAARTGVKNFMLFSYANGYYGYIAPHGEVSYEALSQLIRDESYTRLIESIRSLIT